MTIAEEIKTRVDDLQPPQQLALLSFLESLQTSHQPKARSVKNSRARKAEVRTAVRGIAGMWKDRTDLPKDSVEAVKIIRAQMRSRDRNA